ncbi:unnamed protein product [Trichobilharzia regenti]|nr:unnamed protein product [Trichobilharzia regenti]
MWILEPQINKLIGRNLAGNSSSSYAISNGISYPDNKSPDSESISAFRSDIWSSNTTSLFSRIDLGCPVCQHEFCFSLLLCATEKAQNHLLENTEKVIRDLHTRLHAVSLECTVLRSELEVIHKAFTSKCEALKILTLNVSSITIYRIVLKNLKIFFIKIKGLGYNFAYNVIPLMNQYLLWAIQQHMRLHCVSKSSLLLYFCGNLTQNGIHSY